MRKMNIPKAKQIEGIRKALKNKKTPRAFIPSLKKRLAKLGGSLVFLLACCLLRPPSIAAQTPVTIQPTQQTLAPAGTACTGSAQTFAVNNKNQTLHQAVITGSGLTTLQMQIFGYDSAGNPYLISDTATIPEVNAGSLPILTGTGYYPTVKIILTCAPASTGTFALSYSGSSSGLNENIGGSLLTKIDKVMANGAAANTSLPGSIFQPPFGSTFGTLYFRYGNTGTYAAGSTITVQCAGAVVGSPIQSFQFTLPLASASLQSFIVPDVDCPNALVSYGAVSGAVTSSFFMEYVFAQPGSTLTKAYTHIPGTTATIVKQGPGKVFSVVVGTSAAGTITLFDLAPGSCTGTPATNVVSVITEFASGAPPPPAYIYDTLFQNGICVKASAAMDITVASQ